MIRLTPIGFQNGLRYPDQFQSIGLLGHKLLISTVQLEAAICVVATISVVSVIAIIEGLRDPA
jgi:hypothetical protein